MHKPHSVLSVFRRAEARRAPASATVSPKPPPKPPLTPPRNEGPLAGLPSRLQDLPVEFWLDCGDCLEAASRVALFTHHPLLQAERLAAERLAAVRQAGTAEAVGRPLALASAPPTRHSPQLLAAVIRRGCLLLWDSTSAAQERAAHRLLGDALEAVVSMPAGPRRLRLFCDFLRCVPHPYCAYVSCERLVHGHFMALVLDGLLDAAENGSTMALRALVQPKKSLVSMIDLEHGMPVGAALWPERQARAARFLALLSRPGAVPRTAVDDASTTLALLAQYYFRASADAHVSALLRLMRQPGADVYDATSPIADLLEDVQDAALREELMATLVACAARSAGRPGRASREDVMSHLGRHLERPAQSLHAGARRSLEALLREHGWQGGLHAAAPGL